jgi:hypothetical protein
VKLKSWQVAVEVKLSAALLVGLGLLYFVAGVIIVSTSDASWRTLLLPVTSVVLGALAAGGMALKMPSSRFAAFGVVALFALVHVLVLVAASVLLLKIFSGILAAGYVYAGVLLNSMPVRRYFLGERA